MEITERLYRKAKRIIPGGTQLLSKRPEMFMPDGWPAYYKKAKGCEVWDLDGNRFTDMSHMGVGSCILGYADSDVNNAVKKAINNGTMSTLNCPEEVELAEKLCSIHRWADMVRYARTGGEATTIALRIARAKTSKDMILFCGYHGWHDWYLAANITNSGALRPHLLPGLHPAGVPMGLKKTAIPFEYNNIDKFRNLINKYRGRIAAVIMEPIRNYYPEKNFLETIRKVTKKEGIVLIFDEITAAWRLNIGGAHLKFKVYPDISVFAKAMSNGYPMAAIIGRKSVMEAAQDTFISSTYWTERVGPVAALASVEKIIRCNVPRHLTETGKAVQDGWRQAAERQKVGIDISGIYPLSRFAFRHKKPLAMKTLFTQHMKERGFLATTAFYATYAHRKNHLRSYLKAVDDVFSLMSKSGATKTPERYLKGGVCHSDFKRIT